MASAQCHKPCEETNHHNKNHAHEHSFPEKVKETVHKVFHHEHGHGHPAPAHTHKPTSKCPSGTAHYGEKTEKKKKLVKHSSGGHEGHCMPKMLDHMKSKKKKNKDGGSSSSSSSSESESDHEKILVKKN